MHAITTLLKSQHLSRVDSTTFFPYCQQQFNKCIFRRNQHKDIILYLFDKLPQALIHSKFLDLEGGRLFEAAHTIFSKCSKSFLFFIFFCNKTINGNNKTRRCINQGFCRILWRKQVSAGGRFSRLGWPGLLTFSAFSMGAYSRWALIRGWALTRINTVYLVSDYVHTIP